MKINIDEYDVIEHYVIEPEEKWELKAIHIFKLFGSSLAKKFLQQNQFMYVWQQSMVTRSFFCHHIVAPTWWRVLCKWDANFPYNNQNHFPFKCVPLNILGAKSYWRAKVKVHC